MREICFDTETTGFEPKKGDRIISFGAIELIDRKKTGKVLDFKFDPEMALDSKIIELTGLTDKDLAGQPKFADKADEILEFFGDSTLVAHNAPFDVKFLNSELRKCGKEPLQNKIIDTLIFAKIAITEGKRNLDTLAEKYGVDLSKRTKHGALVDSEILADVYFSLIMEESVVRYNEFLNEIEETKKRFIEFKKEIKNKEIILDRKFEIKPDELNLRNEFLNKNFVDKKTQEIKHIWNDEVKFIHLRNHSDYSLCLGAIRIKKLIAKAKEYKMPAVAVTDSGNMFGALEFAIAAKKDGIQPINGCEFEIEKDGLFPERDPLDTENKKCLGKIVLIAQNDKGFYNLISLASDNFLQRNENKTPRLKFEWLKERSEGIICLTGGCDGLIGKLVLKNRKDDAEKLLLEMRDIFNDRLYIEIMRHGEVIKNENEEKNDYLTEPFFLEFAKKHNIPIVATNDCYFIDKENYKAQDILSCIINKNAETDLKRERRTPEHYIKTQEEMVELFADIPEAINNTVNIAKRISTMAYNRKPTLPHFPLPEGQTEQQYMRQLSEEGLIEKLKQKFINENITDEAKQEEIKKIYFDRLDYEINIIETMDFSGYFLIVSDFIIWSKKNGVPVGPGRGSGAGSVVAWSLKITGVDPINFNISFERFLNPERISMPDFDIDFCQEGRGRSVEYVQNKYGKELVSQIVTFGKLQAKAVIKDVGRILQFGYEFTDALSKRIPEGAKGEGGKSPLQTALDNDAELQKEMQIDPQISEILDISLQLEELSRHSSVHAAGVVIGDKPLREICPLYFAEDADMQTIQYTMKYAEEVGLVKFDFLGLSTLTVIKDVLEDLQIRNIYIDIDNIPLNIAGVFEMLGEGNVVGVFQLESSGMKTTTKQMKPDRITDISALVALYRPGPMGQIPHYIARKNGTEEIKCLHPKMLEILKDTYGVIVYQDQVMNLAKGLAGYTMGGADMLRRAMGKKIKEQMDAQREFFVKGGTIKTTLFGKEVEQEIIGCEKNGIDNDTANKIFDAMAEFASYGFNLAHATAYGIIGYQTAYLKYFFPVEFAVATINDRINNTDNVAMCIQDLRQRNYKILMPDINISDIYFTTECIGEKRTFESLSNDKPNDYDFDAIREDNINYGVRYGLAGIKGLGANVGELIIAERDANGKFKDIFDFISRFNTKVINKKTLEALAKAGAFESIHKNRRQIHDSIEEIIKINAGDLEEKNTKQLNFFDAIDVGEQSLKRLPTMPDWNETDKIEKEFEAFGFYIEGHPLEKVIDELKAKDVVFSNELSERENDDRIIMTGILLSKNTKKGKNGKYLLLKLSDPVGIIELFVFGDDIIAKNRELLEEQKHNKLALSVHLRKDETGEVRLNASGIAKLEDFLSGEVELGNPLAKIIPQLKAKKIKFSNELKELEDKDTFFAAGIVESVKSKQGARGEYLFVTIGDAKGEINFSVFNEEMVRSSYFDEKEHSALALACQVSKDQAGRNRYNVTAMCLLEDFLGGKEEIKLKRKFTGTWNSGNSWNGGSGYKTQGVEIMGEKKSDVIKELYVVVSTPQQMIDVKTIINTTKKEDETEYTKIVLDIGISKIEIPNCQIKEEDLERIKNVRGIVVKEI